MDERTRAYLRGRFRDFYRKQPPAAPPAADRREWGYIPWTAASGTTMIRHQSLLELGDLGDFLARKRPKHVYHSAGRYRDPGAPTMGTKGWQGSDLVFDLDADHLPAVDPATDSYGEMLAACKDSLARLLSFLAEDFGFEDLQVVFSGGRGYHVHVRDPRVLGLNREARREIVDYVRGVGVEFEDVVETTQRGTATARVLKSDGGWGRRTHRRLLALADDLAGLDEAAALERLREFDGIGEARAESSLRVIRENRERLRAGDIERGGPAIRLLAEQLLEATTASDSAAIDEPVTTDTHRLIRLPGSLHGGTALQVTPIPIDGLDAFDPLVDAIPEPFRGHDVAVRGDGGPPVELGGRGLEPRFSLRWPSLRSSRLRVVGSRVRGCPDQID
jgi:DNA primase small subunit